MKVLKRMQFINIVVHSISLLLTFLVYVILHIEPAKHSPIYKSKYPQDQQVSLDSAYISIISTDYDLMRLTFHATLWAENYMKATSNNNILIHVKNESHGTSFNNIPPDPKFFLKSDDIHFKFLQQRMTGINACKMKSQCMWLLSIKDDTALDVENYLEMLKSLEKEIHPVIDPVFITSCSSKSVEDTFMNPNSTFLLSRRAVELVLRAWERFKEESMKSGEIDFGRLVQQLGMTSTEISSPYFIGYRVKKEERMLVKEGKLKECNFSVHNGFCGSVYGRLKDVAVIGGCGRRTECQATLLTSMPEDVYFYTESQSVKLCKVSNETESK